MTTYAPTYNTQAQPQVWNQDAATAYGLQTGLLKQGETATGGLLARRAQEAGQLDALQSYAGNYGNVQAQTPQGESGGFIPATVDPLHQYEKTGLQTLGSPGALGGGSMTMANQYLQKLMQNTQTVNPMAQQYLQQGSQMISDAAKPVTMEQIEQFRNPFAQALKDQLTEEGRQLRAQIASTQGMRGGRSFGDISHGRRESYLDAELGRRSGAIDYGTYNTALDYLKGLQGQQIQAGTNIASLGKAAQDITASGADIGLGLASGVFGAGQKLTDQGFNTARNQIEAGKYIRDYNQRLNDMISANIIGQQQFAPQQIATIQELLKGYQSGLGSQTTTSPSGLAQLGGAATALGGLLSTPTQGNLPWTSLGNVNPAGGYYGF